MNRRTAARDFNVPTDWSARQNVIASDGGGEAGVFRRLTLRSQDQRLRFRKEVLLCL
jgi:hypothetical protein